MSERLTLQDLIDLLAKKQEITKKDAETFLRELFTIIAETIETNDAVKVKDFGTFKLVKVNARKSVDVNTGEAIEIAAHYKLSFTPDKSLRETINRPFAHFESVLLEDGVSFENTVEAEINDLDSNSEDGIVDIIESDDVNNAESSLSITESGEENIEESITIVEETIINNETDAILASDTEIVENQGDGLELASDSDDEEWIEKETFSDKLKKNSNLIALIIIIALLAAVFAGYIYNITRTDSAPVENKVVEDKAVIGDSVPMDTLANKTLRDSISVPDGTLVVKKDIEPEVKPQEVKVQDIKPIKPQTVTIKPGTTLRMIGLEYYGHKSFWVYIYQENRDKIKNPNNVPLNTVLTVPAREKYGIDSKNPESVKKAKEMESKIFREFGID